MASDPLRNPNPAGYRLGRSFINLSQVRQVTGLVKFGDDEEDDEAYDLEPGDVAFWVDYIGIDEVVKDSYTAFVCTEKEREAFLAALEMYWSGR